MASIQLLDKTVSELIAAGEVIERPASIVKELLENSIDAGATAVTVEIRHGGIRYIRVTDNGSGMAGEEIPTAFLRHATSKIRLSDDLNFISTLGFRGEALPSIAAVSRVELTSKRSTDPFGTKVTLEAGELLDTEEVGCPDGTTMIVRDLFYNVPARLKFLRRDTSEAGAIAAILERIALSHPEISFKLISDLKTKLHTPGDGNLLTAIHAVFGAEFAESLIPVDYGMNRISISGFISSDQHSRQNRSMQHFFVNHRYVRSKLCMSALEEGYKNSIMTGKYPFCVLNVTLPYEQVDVNVHPAKTEVRFVDEKSVYDVLYFAVKSSLSREDILKKAAQPAPASSNLLSKFHSEPEAEQVSMPIPSAPLTPPVSPTSPVLQVHDYQVPYRAEKPVAKQEEKPAPQASPSSNEFHFLNADSFKPRAAKDPEITFIREEDTPEESPKEAVAPLSVRIIGEAFRTYVIFESADTLYYLDKHAAHERILYEKLKASVHTGERQILLKPLVVSASPEEYAALTERKSLLEEMGFLYEEFGVNAFLLREVPLVLHKYDVVDLLLDTAQKIAGGKQDASSDMLENLLHSIACRSAIKGGDTTSVEELTALLQQVYANDEIRHCPHGRPVVIAQSKTELEKKFGRISS